MKGFLCATTGRSRQTASIKAKTAFQHRNRLLPSFLNRRCDLDNRDQYMEDKRTLSLRRDVEDLSKSEE